MSDGPPIPRDIEVLRREIEAMLTFRQVEQQEPDYPVEIECRFKSSPQRSTTAG